jgi:outer membrane beta-barrel protein
LTRAVLLALTLSSAAFAQSDDLDEVPGTNKAIQERLYSMTFEIALGGGVNLLDPYTKQVFGGGGLAAHFSDVLALQGRGAYVYNWASSLRQQLERDFQVLSTSFPQINWFVGGDVLLKPFYGKSAVGNVGVLHYEAYLMVGATVFKYSNAFRPALDVGGGVRLFQNKVLSYRFEVLDSIVLTGGGFPQVLQIQLMLCLNIGSTE